MILVVTNGNDVTADYLIEALQERDIPFFRLDTETVPQKIQVELSINRVAEGRIVHGDSIIYLADVDAVWLRRPLPPVLSSQVPSSFAAYLTNETASAIGGILRTFRGLWVNHPTDNARAEFKPLQLCVAQQLGWPVPRSLISSRPAEVKRFFDSCHSKPIIKAIDHGFVQTSDGRTFSAYARDVTATDINDLDAVRHCPVFLQECIPRLREHRVTVIGKEVFSTVISPIDPAAVYVDWRSLDETALKYEAFTLPPAIRDRCIRTVQAFDLRFGALDIIETPSSEFVFLEINPNGQWAWLEMKTGQPMRSAFIELFDGANRDHQ